MRKRLHIALALLLVILGGVIAWQGFKVFREREPVYQGKRLSVWLERTGIQRFQGLQMPFSVNDAAKKAVQGIGTNAIPTLLGMLQAKDSTLWLKLTDLLKKQSVLKMRFTRANTLNMQAQAGFAALGAEAKDAVPQIIKIYERNISPRSQASALGALVAIGPAARAAIPSFLSGTASPDESVRWYAVSGLSEFYADPLAAVPALSKSLSDTNMLIRFAAASALERYGTNAQQAVPALVLSLRDTDLFVREAAARALKGINPDAAVQGGIIPALTNLLYEIGPFKPSAEWLRGLVPLSQQQVNEKIVRRNAIWCLGGFGWKAKPAVPALESLLTDYDLDVRVDTTNALKAIDPEAAARAGVK